MSYKQKSTIVNLNNAIQQDGMKPAQEQVWLANWKKFGLPYCSVYIISPDNHWPCKIGFSNNPRKRIKEIQVCCWRPLKVDYSMFCQSNVDARLLESTMHKELANDGKLLSGEWFDIRADEARELLQFKVDAMGIEAEDTVPDGPVLDDVRTALAYYLGTANAIRCLGSREG